MINDFLKEAFELNELASPKKIGEQNIINLCPTTMNHFAYSFMLPENDSHKHWLDEVATNLTKINHVKLKSPSGKVSVDFIRNNLTWHVDTKEDAEIFVYGAFKVHKPELSVEDIDDEMYIKFQNFMNYLYEVLPDLLIDEKDHSKEFYQVFIQDAIDKYI